MTYKLQITIYDCKGSFDSCADTLSMLKLSLLAEGLCDKASFFCVELVPSKEIVSTIRFSNEDRMVEGELFKTV